MNYCKLFLVLLIPWLAYLYVSEFIGTFCLPPFTFFIFLSVPLVKSKCALKEDNYFYLFQDVWKMT
jgi:hypothetical protein